MTKVGKVAPLIRKKDWARTSLGHPESWPLGLKAMINICLESRYPMFIWWGPDLISFYNDGYAELMGPNKHPKYCGESARDMWSEIWPTLQGFIDRVYEGETVGYDDLMLAVDRNGFKEEAYFSFSYNPARDDSGFINGIFCTCQETTQTILIQRQLKEAHNQTELAHKQLYDFFMQAPAPMVIMLGEDHQFWLANPPYEKLIGRKAAGKNLLEIFSKEEILHFLPLLDGVYQSGKSHIGKEIPFNPEVNGEIQNRFLNIGYHPFLETDETVKGILALVEDVTEQVSLRKQVEINRNELQILSESIPQIVWTSRPDGVLDFTNFRWTEYSGSSEPAAWITFVHPDDVESAGAAWMHSIQTGDDYETEFRLRRIDGVYHYFLVRAAPMKNEEGEITRWYGTCTDIEEQRTTVLQLENEKILREQFVSMLTHDLRSPLSAAKISAQYLSRLTNVTPDKQISLTGRIIDSIDRTNVMIENLLDSNRIKAGEKLPLKFEEMNITELIKDSLLNLSTIHGDRFKLIPEDINVIGHWSNDGLLRILENLCTNAVKFGREHSQVSVALKESKDEVSFSVHNFGKPISEDDQKKLFTPYQRSNNVDKDAVVGWGLGLTLVKGFTESHGGNVKVESNETDGTTFTITIPRDSRHE